MEPTYLTLTIPPGAEPGVDSLTFQYQGQELDILVPLDAKEGDVLQVQVGACEDGGAGDNQAEVGGENDNEEKHPSGLLDELGGIKEDDDHKPAAEEKKESGITTVSLGLNSDHPASLQLLESLPNTNNSKTRSQSNGDGTNTMVWPSGLFLAQALTSPSGIEFLSKYIDCSSRINHRFQVQCLELGSGLGVCGLALGHALISLKEPVDFYVGLTDRGEEAVNLLNENIKRNASLFSSRLCTVKAEELRWGDVTKMTRFADIKFHVILGSDLLYNTQDTYEPLLHTMIQHLMNDCVFGTGMILLAVRWRKPDLEREFFHLAERKGLEFVLWEEVLDTPEFKERCPCRLDWREYGDPKCEASNKFFQETTVSISNSNTDGMGKVEKSLAEITESDMEGMSEDEYTFFEELQVQIYVGRCVNKKKAADNDEVDDDEAKEDSEEDQALMCAKKRGIGDIST